MEAANTDALLLRAVDYAEADRIVTLLTRSGGKQSFIARGARRSRKRFGGALQPFVLLRVELQAGRSALGTLAHAQVQRPFLRLLSDLRRMGAGFVALELVRELSAEHEPDAQVFETTLALLTALDVDPCDPDALLTCFGMRLLCLLGFAPQLSRCGVCGRTAGPSQSTTFDAREGHLVCQPCGGAPVQLGAALRGRLLQAQGEGWRSAAEPGWAGDERGLGMRVLTQFAEHRIGRPLQAGALLQRPGPSP